MVLNDVLDKIVKHEKLTEDEIEYALSFIRETVINRLNNDFGNYRVRCQESSIYIADLSFKLDFAYYGFTTSSLSMKELYHHFGIIGFNGINGPAWYLIDLTYEQFNTKKYPIYINNKSYNVVSPGEYISKENKHQLIKKGYIKLTKSNFLDYIDSFMRSYSIKLSVDKDAVYNKLLSEFNELRININDDDKNSLDTKRIKV